MLEGDVLRLAWHRLECLIKSNVVGNFFLILNCLEIVITLRENKL